MESKKNIMEQLKIAQFYNSITKYASKKEKSNILKKVDVNYCIPLLPGDQQRNKWSGYTRLHSAAKKVALDIISDLLEQGADLFKQGTADGCTPVHVAMDKIFNRKWHDDADEDKTAEKYKNFKTKELQEFRLVNTLLSKQVELNNNLNPKNKLGVSHLHIACFLNHSKAVKLLATDKESLDHSIDCGPDYHNEDFLQMNQFQGYTPLHCAIKYLSVEAADILLQHGADIHAKNGNGMSCMHLLVDLITGMTDFMKMGKRARCMSYIEEIEKIESIIKLVLKTSSRKEILVDNIGFSALHLACTLREKSIVEDLLKQNVDVNMPVENESRFWSGWTPLHFAACFNTDIMILLMKNGADITIKNSKGETALDLCAKRFTPTDIRLIMSTKSEFRAIKLSDNRTKLSDVLSAMNDYDEFRDFLRELKDVNLTIPFHSSIWAGYNLLHLSVSLNEKSLPPKNTARFETAVERYNCTEEEESMYGKRILLCLQYGVSARTKNTKGQTPIHVAFSTLRQPAVVELLLWLCEDDIVDENGLSHLHIACALGQLELVKRYLSRGANANCRVKTSFDWYQKDLSDEDDEKVTNVRENSTPLHVAVAFGHKELVEYLLQESKANVYAKDSLGFTPIHASVLTNYRYTSYSLAQLLLQKVRNLRDSVSKAGLSHLHVAVLADCPKALKKLLQAGAKVDGVVDASVEQQPARLARYAGKTPLQLALDYTGPRSGAEVVKALLKGGADLRVKDPKGRSVLQNSLRKMDDACSVPLVNLLKSAKCDVEMVEASGLTLLHFACADCNTDWVKELLARGADVNARVSADIDLKGATPLYASVVSCNLYEIENRDAIDLAKLLVDSGTDANVVCAKGRTLLHAMYEDMVYENFALDYDESENYEPWYLLPIADLILDSLKSFDVNPVSSQGFTHFHFACVRNKVELVKKFLDRGVDVNQSVDPFTNDTGGFTPLHFALAYHSREVAYVLIERGADVNAEDAYGNTPLHIAFKRDFIDLRLIETMLRRGADICAENLSNETLSQCLLRCSSVTLEAVELFLSCGSFMDIWCTHQGIVGLAMRDSPDGPQTTLEKLTQLCEVKRAIRSGFNVIQNIVSIKETEELTVDNYLIGIEFLMGIGCELDQQDSKGKTALHSAVTFYNLEAVQALLQLGADVNVTNHANECPITFDIIMDVDYSSETHRKDVVKAVACHIWKLKFVGIKVNDSNLTSLQRAELRMPIIRSLEKSCQRELTKAEETHIDKSLTVKDFLSDLGAVARYPRMGFYRRAVVDKFFKSTAKLRREFPEFSSLLALQYRKALARVKLRQPAKEAIALICQTEIPEVCLEDIVRYFTNSEMKMVIESAKLLFDRF